MADRALLHLSLAQPPPRFFDFISFPQSYSHLGRFHNPKLYISPFHLHCSSHTTRTTILLLVSEKARPTRRHFSYGRGVYVEDVDDDDETDDDGDGSGGDWEKKMRRKRKRRWWSDELEDTDDESPGILDQVIDNVWIFKVFKSYGYFLPFIIIPLLVVNGPKAFLMALAVPVGQSAVVLALKKVVGNNKPKVKREGRRRRKPHTRNVSNFGRKEEKKEDKGEKKEMRQRKTGSYPSWVDNSKEEEERNERRKRSKEQYPSWVGYNDGSAERSRGTTSSFGGWDELDSAESISMMSQVRSKPGREEMEKGKRVGNKRGRRERKEPLLLRLLVAMLPFLGSWKNMLW